MKLYSRCLFCRALLIHWPWKSYADIQMYCKEGKKNAPICKHCEKVCESYADALSQMLEDRVNDEKDKLPVQNRDVSDGNSNV